MGMLRKYNTLDKVLRTKAANEIRMAKDLDVQTVMASMSTFELYSPTRPLTAADAIQIEQLHRHSQNSLQ